MSSSRRTSGEIHILAMLDGKAGGPLSRRFLALPAAFWYGATGVGVCILLATLAWLARIPAPAHDAGPGNVAEVTVQPGAPVPAPAPQPRAASASDENAVLVVTALPPSGRASAPAPPGGATIVDEPAAPAIHPPTVRHADPDVATAAHAPPRIAMARPPPATTPSPVPHAGATRIAATHTPAPHRPPSSPAATTARAKRTTPPAPVDTDVALISAIIQHTSAQADSPDAGNTIPCADRRCGPRMPNRQ